MGSRRARWLSIVVGGTCEVEHPRSRRGLRLSRIHRHNPNILMAGHVRAEQQDGLTPWFTCGVGAAGAVMPNWVRQLPVARADACRADRCNARTSDRWVGAAITEHFAEPPRAGAPCTSGRACARRTGVPRRPRTARWTVAPRPHPARSATSVLTRPRPRPEGARAPRAAPPGGAVRHRA